MSDDDRVIRFPGAKAPDVPPKTKAKGKAKPASAAAGLESLPPELADLSADRRKALEVVFSGMPFVCIGIKPSGGGADFFTAADGDVTELTNAHPHLAGVIERLFRRRGLIS